MTSRPLHDIGVLAGRLGWAAREGTPRGGRLRVLDQPPGRGARQAV